MNLRARHPEAFELPQVALQVRLELGVGDQRLLRSFPRAIERVLVRVRAEIVPVPDDALDQWLEAVVGQEIAREEERSPGFVVGEFVQDRFAPSA
jgi:hypothetical protein